MSMILFSAMMVDDMGVQVGGGHKTVCSSDVDHLWLFTASFKWNFNLILNENYLENMSVFV